MTDKDKQLIAEYMGWYFHKGYFLNARKVIREFDSNDASLCVQKMVEKGDWDNFQYVLWRAYTHLDRSGFVRYCMNADNFFVAMASWLRSKK